MTEHFSTFPAEPGWWVDFSTETGDTLSIRVIAWHYDGAYGEPIIVHPAAEDGEKTEPILSAKACAAEHGWEVTGVYREGPGEVEPGTTPGAIPLASEATANIEGAWGGFMTEFCAFSETTNRDAIAYHGLLSIGPGDGPHAGRGWVAPGIHLAVVGAGGHALPALPTLVNADPWPYDR